jgi:hypothetical protein
MLRLARCGQLLSLFKRNADQFSLTNGVLAPMKSLMWVLGLLIVLASLLVAWFAWDARGATHSLDEELAFVDSLSKGKCTKPDEVDRWLLQQSWFHDEASTRLAGIFGQANFGFYIDEPLQQEEVHGAFCISGKELLVRYYERRHVPTSIAFGDPHGVEIKFGVKIVPAGTDRILVRELTSKHMVLHFESSGKEREFYRNR